MVDHQDFAHVGGWCVKSKSHRCPVQVGAPGPQLSCCTSQTFTAAILRDPLQFLHEVEGVMPSVHPNAHPCKPQLFSDFISTLPCCSQR